MLDVLALPTMTVGYDSTGQPLSLIDLRPMDLGDILDGTIRVYRRNPWVFIGIMALVAGIPLVIQESAAQQLAGKLQESMSLLGATDSGPEMLNAIQSYDFYVAVAVWALGVTLMFFFMPISQAATVHAVSETILGRSADMGTSIRAILPKAGHLILAYFLVGMIYLSLFAPVIVLTMVAVSDFDRLWLIAFVLPLLFFVYILLIYLSVKFLFIPHAMVLDDTGAIDGFGRSYRLSSGYWWRTFGISLLVSLIVSMIVWMLGGGVGMVTMLLRLVPNISVIALSAISGLLQTVIMLFIQPLTIIAATLLYYDLRIRKEGFDLLLLAGALAKDDSGTADYSRHVPLG